MDGPLDHRMFWQICREGSSSVKFCFVLQISWSPYMAALIILQIACPVYTVQCWLLVFDCLCISCWQWPHYIRCSINTITCIDCFLCALWYSGTAACNFRICRLFHVPCWFYVYVHFCDECICLCIWYAFCTLIEALIACVVLIAGCSN